MAWARVQGFRVSSQFTTGTFTNTQVTLGSAVAVGDTLCVYTTRSGDPTSSGETLIDNLGNTYTRTAFVYDSSDDQGGSVWRSIITVAGTPTLTFDPGVDQGWLGIFGDHFTGSDAASVQRDGKFQMEINPGTGTDVIDSTSVAAQSGDLMWGGSMGWSGSFTTEVIGTGFTAGLTIDVTMGSLTEWKTATGAGAATFTDATHGSAQTYGTGGIAITPASNLNPHANERRVRVPAILDGWGE